MRHPPFALALLACLSAPTQAGAGPLLGILSEVRGGVLSHDIGFLGGDEETGADINAEVVFVTPWEFGESGFLGWLLQPRPHLGVQVNTGGDTDQIYAGPTWTYHPLGDVRIGLGAGGALHNGELTERVGRKRKALGSRALFRLSAEIGYQLTRAVDVSLYFDHESNAGLLEENEGLNNAGVRVGWRF